MVKQYIVDEEGTVQSVVIDYVLFKKIEEILEDEGLGKLMESISEEDEISFVQAKKELGIEF